jgi:steroid 5-alpha reductase family enzyme
MAYCWVVAGQTHFADGRVNLVTALATAWGVRLTFNFARKGGYRKGGEDYRWVVLRERLGPVGFQLFNLTFIAPFQNALLLMIAAPIVVVAGHPGPLGPFDGLLSLGFVACLVGETIADEQQWRFQAAKAARKARGETGPEFCTTGLFRYSRHPNFFCEVSMWWLIYGFAVVASGALWSWAAWGVVALTGLFQGSTAMTESLSKAKYPSYADYQRTTSRLWPWLPGRR